MRQLPGRRIIDVFLSSTNALREWRLGRSNNDAAMMKRARAEAKAHLARYWSKPVDKLTFTEDRFTVP